MIQPQQYQIDVPIYNRRVLVFINTPNRAIYEALVDAGYEKSVADPASRLSQPTSNSSACTYVFKDFSSLIRFSADDVDPVFHECVAHEIFHAAAAILDHMGIKLGSKSEEAYAYLIGYITRCFYENLKPYGEILAED